MALPAPDGSVYIADTANSRIRKLQDGVVSTYAGSGKRRLVDGNAADARFDWPTSVLVDAKGNVLVCDAENRALRKVTPAGQVTTLAGSGAIRQAGETGDGPGPQAKFTYALYMAADGQGNIYLNDSGHIRKVAPDGVVSTYANGIEPVRWLYGRGGVAVDAKGTLFVADGAILRYVNGSFERFAGKQTGFADGKGEAAMFNGPQGMCFDAAGNLIVADTGNHRIRMVAPDGTVTTLAGSGQAGKADGSALQASFNQPNGVSLDPDGGILVADTGNNAIRRIFQGKVTTYAVPDLDAPQGVAMLKDGRLVVADTKHDQVKVLVP
jgi:sugar lactone lactonase YvrE